MIMFANRNVMTFKVLVSLVLVGGRVVSIFASCWFDTALKREAWAEWIDLKSHASAGVRVFYKKKQLHGGTELAEQEVIPTECQC